MNHPNNNKVYVLARLNELRELINTKRNQLTEVCRRFQHNYSIVFAPSRICIKVEGRFISEFERRLAKKYESYLNDYENLNNACCMEELKEKLREKTKRKYIFQRRMSVVNAVCNHF